MYHSAHSRQRFIDELPEVIWSEFLQRETRWSLLQVRIATYAVGHPGFRQRQVAEACGCSQGAVSKTLARMKQLGVLALSRTRAYAVAWWRRGVRRLTIPPLQQPQTPPRSNQPALTGTGTPEVGGSPEEVESSGSSRALGDVLRGLIGGRPQPTVLGSGGSPARSAATTSA